MCRLEVDGRCHVVFERILPARNAYAPSVARLESRETPFRMRRDEVIPIEYRKIEKLPGRLNTNRVQTDVFRAGATISVPVKTRHWIATATFQFGSKNIGRHATNDSRKANIRKRLLLN